MRELLYLQKKKIQFQARIMVLFTKVFSKKFKMCFWREAFMTRESLKLPLPTEHIFATNI